MRYSVGKEMVLQHLVSVLVLAGLVALPLSAGAQAEESEEAPKQAVEQEPAPSSEPAPEEPALQLKLDAAGVDLVPRPPRTAEGYTLEEMDVRVRRAGIGFGVSVVAMGGGAAMVGIALSNAPPLFCILDCPPSPQAGSLRSAGAA